MKNRIEEGDFVNIYFEHTDALYNVEIIGKSYATGDCWKCRGKDGTLYNVQNYSFMETVKVKQTDTF